MVNLFLAEDDGAMNRMYERAFRLGGFTVECASEGKDALDKLRATNAKPDIILLDVMMPQMSGFEVLREIKKDDALKHIPVILLTNLAGQEDAQKGIELGAALYLVKSEYNPSQIVAKVKEVIGQK